MRKRVLAAASVALVLAPLPALAGELDLDSDGNTLVQTPVPSESTPAPAQPVSGGGDGGGGQAPPTTTVRTYVAVGDGTYCEGRRTVVIPEGQTAQDVQELWNRSYFLAYDRTDPEAWIGMCPFETDGDPVPAVTGEDVIVALRDQLPRPQPVIDPGFGLAGLRMYLETGRPLTYANTVSVAVGAVSVGIEIDAEASYLVDWGDGTVTGPHRTPGEGHPNGTVTHVYTDVGSYDVSVIDTWQVRWRFAGAQGWNEVSGELAAVTLADFEVTERRAVRTR